MDAESLQKIRDIRNLKNPNLRPSPYLRTSFIDDSNKESKIEVRNYQKVGVMNMLITPYCILGDDTGIGKTLQFLTTIGYIWLKEPNFVPIVVTTKSALLQWKKETEKFMQGMEAVVVHGEPVDRQRVYEKFFRNYSPDRKQLLIVSYDQVLYDAEDSIIRDKAKSPRKGFAGELNLARAQHKKMVEITQPWADKMKARVGEKPDWSLYVRARSLGQESKIPPNWTPEDEEILVRFLEAFRICDATQKKLEALREEHRPSKSALGLLSYLKELRAAHSVKLMFGLDEAHKFKNYRGEFHDKIRKMTVEADRIVAMTATPVKNRLMEFFALFRIVLPALFPKVTHFQNQFCVMKLQKISRTRQIPILVGYKNLDEFIRLVEPYYLSRKKKDVASELPDLLSKEIYCELHELQDELYGDAELGLMDTNPDDEDAAAEILKSMTDCQKAANSPTLFFDEEGVQYEGPSSKVDAILNILDEAIDSKTIIFSKSEKMISLIEEKLKSEKIKCVRITGKETKVQDREKSKNLFQDENSGVDVILITTAGSESLNLQAADNFIFVDLPWSIGDYLQLIGRMIRIGSKHSTVTAHHLFAIRRNGKRTIDHHVFKALKSKKALYDKVAGDSLVGGLQMTKDEKATDIRTEVLLAVHEENKDADTTRKQVSKLKAKRAEKKSPFDEVPIDDSILLMGK